MESHWTVSLRSKLRPLLPLLPLTSTATPRVIRESPHSSLVLNHVVSYSGTLPNHKLTLNLSESFVTPKDLTLSRRT